MGNPRSNQSSLTPLIFPLIPHPPIVDLSDRAPLFAEAVAQATALQRIGVPLGVMTK